MEQAAKEKLGAEQLAGLSRLKLGLPPPGIRSGRTVADTIADAHTKYYSHIWESLQFFFPSYCFHRPPGFKKLVSMFDELELESDQFENLDEMFTTLSADVRTLLRRDAWYDLLLIERAIAKSRIAPRVRDSAKQVEQRLRSIRIGPRRIVDRGGIFFVALKTDLITAFGYPGRDPRRARPAKRMIRAAIFRRSGTNRPELTWLA